RKLVRFVAINLGILFVALMAVVGALVYKSLTVAPRQPAEPAIEVPSPESVTEGLIGLPAGARIISQSLSGHRISLLLDLPDGTRAIHLYDLRAGRLVGRFAIGTE